MDQPQLTQEQIDALPDTLVLPLRKPIVHGKETFTELTFEEPLSGHLDAVSNLDNIKATIQLLASMANVNARVIAGMTLRDFKKAEAFLSSFTQDALPTGPAA